MIKIKKLHHSAYRCKNTHKTKEFYVNFLGLKFTKAFIISLKSRVAPEGLVVLRLRLPARQMLRFPILQRLLVTNAYNNPMFFCHLIFYFSESRWRPHSS